MSGLIADNFFPSLGWPNSVFLEKWYRRKKLTTALIALFAASACNGSISFTKATDMVVDINSEASPALAILKKAWSRSKSEVGMIVAAKESSAIAT
ncbi:hypothetical protein D3C85_1440710 [compost metagenome]